MNFSSLLLGIIVTVLAWISGIFGAMLAYVAIKDHYSMSERTLTEKIVLQVVFAGGMLAFWYLFK